ncbi:helix-turn-helix domain-containing protein [Macrococcus bovicus]|uniref:helix-turn-helix domain-containing protein n=1 Tax=Macrococcus bovicus TaxID=69968 RepID=UPI0025A5614D|nr:helix-turn-helix transcriptional regulator [Macrococcus bovicus]WJP97106.1 helix-turn-helix transcriptional regulator [Macrococcus bovicus]
MIANNLKKLRTSRDLSLSQLAEQLNKKYTPKFSKPTLSRWEEGTSSPSIEHASALANFYGITLDELACRIDESTLDNTHQYTEALAAHIDKDATEEEIEEILAYIDMKRKLRRNKKK